MLFDRERVKEKLSIEREKIDLEKQEKYAKWELKKKKTIQTTKLDKERLNLARDTEDSKIILQDASLLNEENKKWLHMKKKEIHPQREMRMIHSCIASMSVKFYFGMC